MPITRIQHLAQLVMRQLERVQLHRLAFAALGDEAEPVDLGVPRVAADVRLREAGLHTREAHADSEQMQLQRGEASQAMQTRPRSRSCLQIKAGWTLDLHGRLRHVC